MAPQPQASRPSMPEGYGVPETDEGLLEWGWAVERLEAALNYWFATTRPDGRPHAMPAWAVFLDGTLYFEGSPLTRRARNLAANAAVVVHLESGDEVVIVEGVAEPASATERDVEAYDAKYAYRPSPGEGWYRVVPTRALAWRETDYPRSTTRFDFEDR